MMTPMTAVPGIEGRVLRNGHEAYEHMRRGAVWHAGVPDRFPEVIVMATNEQDVVGAVVLARREGLGIAVRSGGHSWSGSHLRDRTVLIDLSNLRRVEVAPEAMVATVQPGLRGSELDRILSPLGLFFPVGHSAGVGLGGYLLQGGYGWAGRHYGPACMSVVGIDAVTADGELVHADETQNLDLLWAARGAGPGFFAVVTRFHLRLHARPSVIMTSSYAFAQDAIPDLLAFVHEAGRATPTELSAACARLPLTGGEVTGMLTATAFADTAAEAVEQLRLFESFDGLPRALDSQTHRLAEIAELTAGADRALIDDSKRWLADNVGTHASFAQLRPTLADMLASFPSAPSHLVLWNWGGYAEQPDRPEMAFSMDDELYYAMYVAWSDPRETERHTGWLTEHMRALEPFASGTMLADENLLNRPFRFMDGHKLARLDELREIWDPKGRFVPWLSRPALR